MRPTGTPLLLASLVALLAIAQPAETRAGTLVALVHPGNTIETLSVREVTRIYTLTRQRWPDGRPISIYLPPASSEAAELLALRVLNLGGESDILAFYLRAIFRQKITDMPETLPNVEAAIRRIAQDPGGIALVPEGTVRSEPGVRTLPLDGL